MRGRCFSALQAWKALAEARGKFLIDAVEAAIGENGDDVAGRELRRDGGTIASASARSSAWRACRVERADDFFRVQALGFGNALLLIDASEHDVIGERRLATRSAASTLRRSVLERGSSTAHRRAWDRRSAARGGFREWPWGGGRSLR